jgi:hypothetical protein
VEVGGHGLQLAVDPVARDQLRDRVHRRLVAVGVEGGHVTSVPLQELGVDGAVLRGDLAGRTARRAARDAVLVEQDHVQPALGEPQGGRDPDDPAADHDHVGAVGAGWQRGALGRQRCVRRARLAEVES